MINTMRMINKSKTDLTFFYRNPTAGFSILKVFRTLEDEIRTRHHVNSINVPFRRADPLSVLKNILFVFKHRNKTGINHVTGDIHYAIIALIGCKSVLTVHDLNVYNRAVNPIKRMFINLLWFKLPLWIANEVVCISEHTKSELEKISSRKDIKVIYNAVDPTHVFKPKIFNEQCPVVLQIGTAWNKNMERTILALEHIECHLIIIGAINREIETLLEKTKQSYTVKTDLTDKQLLQEYDNCDLITFCSTYEGFGMPITEGNAVGRCVVTSDISPMTEIGADAVAFANPYDLTSIADALLRIINSGKYRDSLIVNGHKNVERFQVKEISSSYESIYKSLGTTLK